MKESRRSNPNPNPNPNRHVVHMLTYAENERAQTSAGWRSGGSSQRQSMPQAVPGSGEPRPTLTRGGVANQPRVNGQSVGRAVLTGHLGLGYDISAPPSLGQPVVWAVLTGHLGRGYDMGAHAASSTTSLTLTLNLTRIPNPNPNDIDAHAARCTVSPQRARRYRPPRRDPHLDARRCACCQFAPRVGWARRAAAASHQTAAAGC
eukprot:scaffold54909_cov31-Phaeocystis_antarctica.AAC.1